MNEKFTISLPANSVNKKVLATLNDDFILLERKPLGPQANILIEILNHCFVEISNGALSALGEHIFLELLLPALQTNIEKPTIMKVGGSIVETEITKYLNRVALRVICPVYKEKLKRQQETRFYFLIDSEWSREELELAVLLFKEEMQKFISNEPNKIDQIVSHDVVAHDVVLNWDKSTGELVYAGPIPKHILDRTL